MATAINDFIQGIIMIVGVVMMFFYLLASPQVDWNLSTLNWFTFNSANKGIYGDTVSLLSLILLTSFGVWALPQTIHKYHAVRDDKAIKQGMIVSTLFALIIGFGAYFIGGLGGLFTEELASANVKFGSDDTIPVMLVAVIPAGLMGIIAVLILSASMSTLSSVSLASASVIAVDLYKGSIKKDAADKKVTLVMRVLCLLFILLSVVLAILNQKYSITAITYLMGISWGTLAGCFIGPFVLGLLWKRVTKAAAWSSIISCLMLTVSLIIIFGYDKNDWNATFATAVKSGVATSPLIGVICMLSSIVITIVVSLCTKKPSDEILYEAFEKSVEGEIK